MAPTITRIESREFQYPLEDVGTDRNGFNLVYEPGETTRRKLFGIKIHTDVGLTGEYVGGNSPGAAHRHCIAATRNTNYYELALLHPNCRNTQPPVYRGGYSGTIETIDERGRVTVSDGPGLGVDYDWEYIEEHRTGDLHVYE
ncbi:hypothetical protein HT576_20740 [Haloterrigena sp. SYSU A121-1]|uniref:Enolase C-terminal domain-containing protein n=1 Tax=Haloterrigena gelatinilytica TaxID=2741724 RepID=A0A8J8GS11_9EURY|nr:hypothetical protein [Haloterrigena gelatinilytica]NUB93429.1 hypothetical protein [Haloterrigena gelatinilytica]